MADETPTAPATKPYKLRPGFVHSGANAGDVVQLTESQYRAFSDRFEPDEKKGETVTLEPPDGVEKNIKTLEEKLKEQREILAARSVPTSHVPQDIGGKTLDHSVPDPNPGNLVERRPAITVPVAVPSMASEPTTEEATHMPGVQPGDNTPVPPAPGAQRTTAPAARPAPAAPKAGEPGGPPAAPKAGEPGGPPVKSDVKK